MRWAERPLLQTEGHGMNATQANQTELLKRADALAESEPGFALFLRTAAKSSDPEDLAQAPLQQLENRLRRAFALLTEFSEDESQVVITTSTDSAEPIIIDVISPDMPFIVDSVLAAVRASGGTTRLFAHPMVRVADGQVSSDGRPVSLLHIHSDPVADTDALRHEIEATMQEVAQATSDWNAMQERVSAAAQLLTQTGGEEAAQFLDWLLQHNFTFLGTRTYDLSAGELVPVDGSGLGIMRDPDLRVLRSGPDFVHSTQQHASFLSEPEPLLITKANLRARVHRRTHLDYVGIKRFDAEGKPIGELRVVGLFTAQAQATPHAQVPIVRRKIAAVMQRSGFDPQGHDGRTLLAALESYPRDELFQIDIDQLEEFATTIAALHDRPRVRVLPRIDRFDNFVSVLVYVPRDRYDAEVRSRITDYLARVYDGRVSAFYPHFLEASLVRVHVIIGRVGGPTPRPNRAELEAEVEKLTAQFGDLLMAAAPDPAAVSDYRSAFSAAYQTRNTAADAAADIAVLQSLGEGIAVRLRDCGNGQIGLKYYQRHDAIPLSERVPMLEAFGFRVIEERTDTVIPRDRTRYYVHDMSVELANDQPFDLAGRREAVEDGLLAVWDGRAESDQLNSLVTRSDLDWSDAALLRALSRYLRQVGISYSQRYIALVLVTQSQAAAALVELFNALHDPSTTGRETKADAARARIADCLDAMTSLDEDTIVRRFLNLIEAALRTNAFQNDAEGNYCPALAIKFDSSQIEGMPEPRPYREISVYSPRVEGIHLRFGAIARGGIRWSDRPEDFRTEVLGLVKAQQVKNAVIVPVGAKGGFVPKHLKAGMAREAVQAEGLAAYKIFIGSLLDVTDNLVDGQVVPPQEVVCRDASDPYLVVAADKGTASFSDTANGIAQSRGYWLGDAFASGGSAGYDHKEMGITARGAWELVKRHFREVDRDIQTQPFTVAGVGDMSGDVFGNGMLLSREIRLIAAFDHRDIFIDPDPDPAKSFAERERLFKLPRSSWQDYDKSLISGGGGVFSRGAKSIALSSQMRAVLDLEGEHATPAEIMSAILRARVDLLWFGGIGTYIRASTETDAEVGDRANDAIRVAADQLRAFAIGEGANLGLTQRGRVEFALRGGRINTDAIDNSAGVNSSDLEVNIKIAVAPLLANGTLTLEERNQFLAGMTEEVAALCLRNNYLQGLALSLTEREGLGALPDHRELMHALEQRGLLNRKVEVLPTDAALDQRETALTRPELAVLLAYAKLTLYADLLDSTAIDDPYLAGELFRYFPDKLHQTYPEAVRQHRLKREVIATVLANAMINRGGPAFANELVAGTSAGPGDIALAYAATRDVFGLPELNAMVDALDNEISGTVQLELYAAIQALLRQEVLWFLRNEDVTQGLSELVQRHRAGAEFLREQIGTLRPELQRGIAATVDSLVARSVPPQLARRVAELPLLSFASDVVTVSERVGVPVQHGATAFFGVLATFDLMNVIEQGRSLRLADRFERMALDRALANLVRAQRDLTVDVLRSDVGNVAERLANWTGARQAGVERTAAAVADLTQGTLTVSRLSVAAGLLADLARED
jgi:glutamate dehydrogenase